METWADILLLALIVICTGISGGALLWAFMEWRAQRMVRRDREMFERRLRQ